MGRVGESWGWVLRDGGGSRRLISELGGVGMNLTFFLLQLRVFCGAVEITQILIPVGLPLIWEPFVRVLEDAEVEKQI